MWVSVDDPYAIVQKIVFLTVGLKSRMSCAHLNDDADSVLVGFGGKAGIKVFERLAQVAYQRDILVADPAQRPV